jgi:hypothetical protein
MPYGKIVNVPISSAKSDLREDNSVREGSVYPLVGVEDGVGFRELNGKRVSLLTLPLPAVVCSRTIPLDAFDAALFFLVLGLRPLTRWQRCLGFWEFLTP